MLVLSNKSGQLGNRLFAFAHLIAVARRNDLQIVNLSFDEYAKYFSTTSKDIWCRYPAKPSIIRPEKLRSFLFLLNRISLKLLRALKWTEGPLHAIIVADLPEYNFNDGRFYKLDDEKFVTIAKKRKVVFLFGRFFRADGHLYDYQAEIKEYFTPVPSLRSEIDTFIAATRIGCEMLVGVHIRRGDYRLFVNGKYFYSPEDYHRIIIKLAASCGVRMRFLICSNEEIDLNVFGGLDVVKAPGHFVVDLYCLSECDYIMGPPSTFTKWAAFYGSKPLYHIWSLPENIQLADFSLLPPEVLYNFSFN